MRDPRRAAAARAAAARAAAALLAAAVLLPLVPVVPFAAGPLAPSALAASPGLTLVSDARYQVQPAKRRVRVVVDVRASNQLAATKAGSFYFERAGLALLPGIGGLTVAERNPPAGAGPPTVAVTARTSGYTVVSIAFGRRLLSGQTIALRLQFDLPDPGGAPTRLVRIGETLLGFPVWAFASSSGSGSTVTVQVPKGFRVSLATGRMPETSTTSSGDTVLRSGPIAKPLSFYAYVRADRPAALVTTATTATVGGRSIRLTIRSFPDESAWTTRTGELFSEALPRLSEAVGLPFPGDGLTIEESSDRATGGYAGLFDVSTATVRVAYDARPGVALHEAAHAWFNGRLLAERWANEAFASAYAATIAPAMDLKLSTPRLTKRLTANRIPLNAWAGVGEASAGTEDYGYAAAELLGRAVIERAGGVEALRPVWAAALANESAYQPRTAAGLVGEVEPADATASASPDWRGLLDLLEQRTGVAYDDLWRRWVVRPREAALLEERAATLVRYEAAVRRAGPWRLSPQVRRALEAWQFAAARDLIVESIAALRTWDRVRAAADAAGLTPSPGARRRFEGAAGPAAARIVMERELDVLDALALARAEGATAASLTPVGRVGLLFEEPAADLAAGERAYEAGDLDAAIAAASDAYGAVANAGEVGRRRLWLALFGAIVLGGTVVAVVPAYRRRRGDATLASPVATTAGEE